MKTILPPTLKPGDKVGLISPSNTVADRLEVMDKAIGQLERELNIQIVSGEYAFGQRFYTSGTVEEKLNDLHQMVADPDVKAIFFSIGGKVAIELIDRIDYELIKKNPKIFLGISDSTTILNPIYAMTGLITFFGFEMHEFGRRDMPFEIEMMKKVLFDGENIDYYQNKNWCDFYSSKARYHGWNCIRLGKAEGKLVGGTANSIILLGQSEYCPDFKDNILVLEDFMKSKNDIHRILSYFRLHGVFDIISGLILGYFCGSDSNAKLGNDRELRDLVLEITDGYDFPIMQVGEIGHYVENIILPIGGKVWMDAEELKFGMGERKVIS